MKVFDEHEIICRGVDLPDCNYIPRTAGPIFESVSRSRRLLIVEEGIGFAAFGAEVIAQIQEHAPGTMQQVRRPSCPDQPIPAWKARIWKRKCCRTPVPFPGRLWR